ncbi:MAG: RNA 3'-terminal phosphate cyclase [Candidatus Latescibacterota bacterium]|nr:MAG: RNA 3'-terminal phosphate cyclase [Candidatus Latescibacterota bacterium]
MLTIDGSAGEGGGQILRTALALALVTGKAFRIRKIRAQRKRPGLQRQHLTAVTAAAQVGKAEVLGAALGSQEMSFRPLRAPERAEAREFRFDIGTAGSTTLVLQTVLPPLLTAAGASTLLLVGGTHNPMCPPFDFIQETFIPLINRMGPEVTLQLERHGFYPAGGGKVRVHVKPSARLRRLDLLERGTIHRKRARALIARLPTHIAQRELKIVGDGLSIGGDDLETVEIHASHGPGNVLLIEVAGEFVTEIFTGHGMKGVPAERVARGAVREARRYLDAGVPVGAHLADQLLLPLALAGGGSFRTLTPSSHTRTNIDVIQQFLDIEIRADPEDETVWRILVGSRT